MACSTRGAVIRKLSADEAPLYRNFLLGLDAQSRRDRFFVHASDAYVMAHADRTWDGNTLLHGCFVDGELRGVAELHLGAHGPAAEAAFVVDPALRNQGIGTALLEATVLAARNRGYRCIRVACLRNNFAMRRLAQKAEAKLMLTFDEVHGEIVAPTPTPLSRLRETALDTYDTAARLWRSPVQKAGATG